MQPPGPLASPAPDQGACVSISSGIPGLTNADYRRIFEVSRYTAARELRRLVEGGLLRMEGKGRGARYLPEPALVVPGNRAK